MKLKGGKMKKMLVLLVDDEPDFLEVIQYTLEAENYNVITASNGKHAIELIKKDKPHIVFLDVMMPEMGGIETLQCIRSFDKNIPVVIMTGQDDEGVWKDATELNIDSFIPKGKSGTNITDVMLNILKTHRS